MLDFIKLDIKNEHQVQQLPGLTIRDAAPESYEVRPESLETFEPSYASSKVKNENDAIRNRISDFDKRRISQPKKPINKLAMNNRRLPIAAAFHFVHPVEKDG